MEKYTDLKAAVGTLISFNEETVKKREEANRELRDLPFNKEELVKSGAILSDGVFIPMRLINDNIRRGAPQYANWLSMPQRLILLKDAQEPAKSFEMLDAAYTTGMRYEGWKDPYLLAADSGELHGLGFVKVLYDPAAPLHVSISYVPYSDVLYDKECINLQRQALIAIRSRWIQGELEAEEEFDKEVIKKLVGDNKDPNKMFEVYQCFFRKDSKVYTCWYVCGGADYLRAPKPLGMGRQKSESTYPIFYYRMFKTEDLKLANAKGRAYYDKDVQEAVTVTWSSVCSANKRAAGFYPTADGNIDGQDGIAKFVLQQGKLSPLPIKLNQLVYPPASALTVMDSLVRQQQAAQGYTDFAAMSREDSNKTATEINASREVRTEQTGQVLSNFSAFFQEVNQYAWELVQSYAMEDTIQLYGKVVGAMTDPVTGKTVKVFENDKELLDRDFRVAAAGDVEFARRQQLQQLYGQFGQTFQGTPVGKALTYELLQTMFPEQPRFAEIFKQTNVVGDIAVGIGKALIQMMSSGQAIDPAQLQQANEQLTQLEQLYGNSSGLFLTMDRASTDPTPIEAVGATAPGLIPAGGEQPLPA